MEETLTAHAHPRHLATTLATTATGPHGDTDTAATTHATIPHTVVPVLVPTLLTSPSPHLCQ